MKYTFVKEDGSKKTVEIADDWISKTRKSLGISTNEAIQLWLCDNDYISNEEQDLLNEKAAKANAGMRVQPKARKRPARKPDDVKRSVVQYIYDCIENAGSSQAWAATNVAVTNIERIVSFTIGDEQYEITLTKKRKPKVS